MENLMIHLADRERKEGKRRLCDCDRIIALQNGWPAKTTINKKGNGNNKINEKSELQTNRCPECGER